MQPWLYRHIPFNPTRFSDCALWVESDKGITLVDEAAAACADQSGNDRDLVQTTPANRLAYITAVLNGRPVLRSADALAARNMVNTGITGFSGATEITQITVFRTITQKENSHVISPENAWLRLSTSLVGADFRILSYVGAKGGYFVGDSSWQVITQVYDGSGADDDAKLKVYKNGLQKTQTWLSTPVPSSAPNCTQIMLGNYYGAPDTYYVFVGDFAFLAIWLRVLTTDELMRVWTFLSQWSGISLEI